MCCKGKKNKGESCNKFHSFFLRKEVNYIDGKKEGLWEEYYDNGQLKAKGVYKEGKEDGTWEVFNEQGQLKAKINYRMGIKMKTEKFE